MKESERLQMPQPAIEQVEAMSFDEEAGEQLEEVSVASSLLNTSDSSGSVRVLEFNDDGTVKAPERPSSIQLVDLS